ncbi:THAP domain-containing protein 3 [Suricata suricatta]|uniref:THAP domain-containing protein 3 n=1 Tax=Suricata suricatta TaxID=37032 RepID=UPI00115536FC|nr:THAP domain-containing protein 3 [Suricata suricatta]
MPKSCAARQCCNRYSSRRKQLTFHRFPFSRPELLKEWVLNMGRGDFEPKQHTVICSEHFRPECFSAFGNRKNLKQNAVPTVFAFQDAAQLVRENTDPAAGGADADLEKEEVASEAGPEACGLGRKTDAALEALPPNASGPAEQVRCGPGAGAACGCSGSARGGKGVPSNRVMPSGARAASSTDSDLPGRAGGCGRQGRCGRRGPGGPASLPASPTQPSDHSYALLDLDTLKKKLFLTLKENERLRKRVKAQRLAIQRMSGRLRAPRAAQRGPQARPRPEQQS